MRNVLFALAGSVLLCGCGTMGYGYDYGYGYRQPAIVGNGAGYGEYPSFRIEACAGAGYGRVVGYDGSLSTCYRIGHQPLNDYTCARFGYCSPIGYLYSDRYRYNNGYYRDYYRGRYGRDYYRNRGPDYRWDGPTARRSDDTPYNEYRNRADRRNDDRARSRDREYSEVHRQVEGPGNRTRVITRRQERNDRSRRDRDD